MCTTLFSIVCRTFFLIFWFVTFFLIIKQRNFLWKYDTFFQFHNFFFIWVKNLARQMGIMTAWLYKNVLWIVQIHSFNSKKCCRKLLFFIKICFLSSFKRIDQIRLVNFFLTLSLFKKFSDIINFSGHCQQVSV